MNIKLLLPAVVLVALLYSCTGKPAANAPKDNTPKGELAFLLQYNGQMPSDVGLLRNQVVQRRLGNILKDSFQVFLSKTVYDRPIGVSKEEQLVFAQFYSDSDRSMPSADLTIDVEQDAIWVEYLSGDSIVEYTDHPSLQKPGLVAD